MEYLDLILKKYVWRMPVLDKSYKAMGLCYSWDVLFNITGVMLDEDNEGEK
jgi:hypothetical protein